MKNLQYGAGYLVLSSMTFNGLLEIISGTTYFQNYLFPHCCESVKQSWRQIILSSLYYV